MMMRSRDLSSYFIAIVPPEPVYSEALLFKKTIAERFQSKAALKSPPHITLHMPFQWKDVKEEFLMDRLTEFIKHYKQFNLELDGFSSFPPRVIFGKVIETASLKILQADLTKFCKQTFNLFNSNYRDYPYHPHLTLAFRDLKKDRFDEAWSAFAIQQWVRSFTVDTIALLKHNGQTWDIHIRFPLS